MAGIERRQPNPEQGTKTPTEATNQVVQKMKGESGTANITMLFGCGALGMSVASALFMAGGYRAPGIALGVAAFADGVVAAMNVLANRGKCKSE